MNFGGILCCGLLFFREVQFLSFYLLTHSCIKFTMLFTYWTSIWLVNSYGSLISFFFFAFALPLTVSVPLIPRLVKVMCKRRPPFSSLHLRHCQRLSSHLMYISKHKGFNLIALLAVWSLAIHTLRTLGIQAVRQPLSFHEEPRSFNWKGKWVLMKLFLPVVLSVKFSPGFLSALLGYLLLFAVIWDDCVRDDPACIQHHPPAGGLPKT